MPAAETEARTKHTPGPWHCKNADGKWASAMDWRVDHDDFGNGSWLPVRAGKKVLALAFCGDGPNSVRAEAELDANARLISAAPDLLAALREVVAISDRKHNAWDKARAAILKAEAR